jgi:Zn-dependent protease
MDGTPSHAGLALPIRASRGWIVLFVLLLAITFDTLSPDRGTGDRVIWYATAVVVTVSGVFSLLLHGYAHAVAARRIGGSVSGFYPALFGAVPDEAYQPKSPRDDALVATAGPAVSLLLSILFAVAWLLLPDRSSTPGAIVGSIAVINLVIGVGNLLPGFPLDGGRIFRSFIWFLTDDIVMGTRFAAAFGHIIAVTALVCGVLLFTLGETFSVWGAWLLLAFWAINRAGREGYDHTLWRATTSDLTVFDVGLSNSRRIDADRSIDSAIDDLLATINEGPMLVTEAGDVLGLVSLAQIRKVPRAIWPDRAIRDVTVALADTPTFPHDAPVTDLLAAFDNGAALVAVSTHGRITGAVDQTIVETRIRRRMTEVQAERRRRLRR